MCFYRKDCEKTSSCSFSSSFSSLLEFWSAAGKRALVERSFDVFYFIELLRMGGGAAVFTLSGSFVSLSFAGGCGKVRSFRVWGFAFGGGVFGFVGRSCFSI